MRKWWWFLQNVVDRAGAERRSIERINRAVDELATALAWYGQSSAEATAALVRLLEDAKVRAQAGQR